jgi:predicted TIM-barrel fold metal-dependent hydrolase
MNAAIALPADLAKFAGRIMDTDSHEMIPLQKWLEIYGPEVTDMVDIWTDNPTDESADKNSPNVPGFPGDILPIDANVINIKGCRAPGAVEPGRRLQVMDALGIDKQLMFSSYIGGYAMMLLMNVDNPAFMSGLRGDRRAVARKLIAVYNRWAGDVAAVSRRIRPVAMLEGDSVDALFKEAEALIARGIKAVQLPSGILPGGMSPAHDDLDRVWSLLAEADCAVTLHIGQEGKFFSTREWGNASVFSGYKTFGEFSIDPWSLATIHMSYANFLSIMVTGGVFERHPRLRFGVIEVGAYWLGELLETLDFWHANAAKMFNVPGTYRLPELPSYYIKRNVRVTPFPFEDVGRLLSRYDVKDILTFSSDYPHVEGGKNTLRVLYDKVAPFGADVLEKFFVLNGEWLLPD